MAKGGYETNTKAQYEALGRFVEEFELMVAEVREAIATLLQRDNSHRKLVYTIIHHGALTAKPLFEIFRAIVVEIIDDAIDYQKQYALTPPTLLSTPPLRTDVVGSPLNISAQDKNTFLGVLATISSEYNDLISMRNSLLHATWFVGYGSPTDPESLEFYVQKFTPSKNGLKRLDLPKSADQLKALSRRCGEARTWIGFVLTCLIGSDKIDDCFHNERGVWYLTIYSGGKTTLP